MHFNLYKVVWYFIHLLFTIFQTVCYSCAAVRRALVHVFSSYRGATSVLKEVCDDVGRLRKVPTHITVLLDGEQPSYKNLAKIVVWSLASGVSFISFYDYEGELKKNKSELQHEVEKMLPQNNRIIWHGESDTYKNGFVGKKIHLKIYSKEDGQTSIANACKELINSKEFDVNTLDSILRKQYEFPDPQLAAYCGDHLNLRGYPPWQTRLTEFFSIGSHRSITHLQFLGVLRCYDRCEQRALRNSCCNMKLETYYNDITYIIFIHKNIYEGRGIYLHIYGGKNLDNNQTPPEVVMKLAEPVLDCARTMVTDNLYTKPTISRTTHK